MNAGYEYRGVVTPADAGATLLDHLARRYRHSTRQEWRERIMGGLVRVDGRPVTPETLLLVGQSIVWSRPPWSEPAAPLFWALLHRDEDLLAVAKPAGLPTLPGGGFLEHTLLALVRRRFPGAASLHRLDRGASGLVLFALSARARRTLARAFQDGRIAKEYRALVSGAPREERFAITTPIGRLPHPRLGMAAVHAAGEAGAAGGSARDRASRTEVAVLERRGAETLVEARPVTGRPHQIRIHLAAAGLPLVGDPLYASGGGVREDAGAMGQGGYHLHATRVRFDHPSGAGPIEVVCRPPAVLRTSGESR